MCPPGWATHPVVFFRVIWREPVAVDCRLCMFLHIDHPPPRYAGGIKANTGPPLDNGAIDCPLRRDLGTLNNNKMGGLSSPGRMDNHIPSPSCTLLDLQQQDVGVARWRGTKGLISAGSLASSIPLFSSWESVREFGLASAVEHGHIVIEATVPLQGWDPSPPTDNGAAIPS